VIPDLARWGDWTQIDRLCELFKTANDDNSWVRVPVVNYLRACPLPEAKERLVELEKIDPKAVKRAATFFPIPSPGGPKKESEKDPNPAAKPGQPVPQPASSSSSSWTPRKKLPGGLVAWRSQAGLTLSDGQLQTVGISEIRGAQDLSDGQRVPEAVFLLNSRIVFSVLACSVGACGLALWMISTGTDSIG
jgi:hypothetical protein